MSQGNRKSSLRDKSTRSSSNQPINQDADERSTRERALDSAILFNELAGKIAESTDLLAPLKAASGILGFMLDKSKKAHQANEDWQNLIKRLKTHLATIENQTASLEEDYEADGDSLHATPNQEVKDLLNEYINELQDIDQQLLKKQPKLKALWKRVVDTDADKGTIAAKTTEMNDAFQRYTASLQLSVANTVKQTQTDLAQFHREFREEATKTRLNRIKGSNEYGNQHTVCLEGTRIKTMAKIHSWIDDKNSTRQIFYLLDVAGSGKSTVSKQVFKDLEANGRLVGRFFFSRDTEETMSVNRFCSSISDTFAYRNAAFKLSVDEFKKRPDFQGLSFAKQLGGMVLEPLKLLNMPAVLIVDAVDECNNDYGGRDQLLDAIHNLYASTPLLRIFITGRPGVDITKRAKDSVGFTNFREIEGPNKDVERYIHDRLQKLLNEDQRQEVIDGAGGHFIWARTACDMLLTAINPTDSIKLLSKEVTLEDLYGVALDQAVPKDTSSRHAVSLVLAMIMAAQSPLSIAELDIFASKMSQEPSDVDAVVSRLGSFLVYDGRDDPIRLLHITFRDFVTDRSKSGPYFVQVKRGHYALASASIHIVSDMDTQAAFNARNLSQVSKRKVEQMVPSNY